MEDLLRSFTVAGDNAAVLGETAEVAWGVAEPAAGGPLGRVGFRIEAVESQSVKFGEPFGGGGLGGPGDDGVVGCGAGMLHAAGTRLKGCGEAGEAGEAVGDQIGLYAALFHFALDGLPPGGDADRCRFVLAKLIFENTQSLVQGGNEEVGYAVADRAALSGWISGNAKGGGAEHIGGDQQGAAFLVEFASVKERSAESRLAVGACIGAGEGEQSGVKTLCGDGKDKISVTGICLHGIDSGQEASWVHVHCGADYRAEGCRVVLLHAFNF